MACFDEHESYFDPVIADQKTLFCIRAHLWGEVIFLSVLPLQVVDAPQGMFRRFSIADAHKQYQHAVVQRRPKQSVQIP